MPEFKFKLDAVLDYRKKMEDQRKKELAEMRDMLRREQILLQHLDRKRKDVMDRLRIRQADAMNAADLMNYYSYINDFREKILSQIMLIRDLIVHIDTKRDDLVAAAKDRKIIEKLKENRFAEFKSTMERLETRMMDEIATSGFNYKHANVRS